MQKIKNSFKTSRWKSMLLIIFLLLTALSVLGCEDETTSSQNASAGQTSAAKASTTSVSAPPATETETEQEPQQTESPIKTIKAEVLRIVDGDTIEVKFGEVSEKVRFIGVDTPETKHPSKPVEYYGKEASTYTTSKLSGKTIYLELDVQSKDKYGRLLAYIWLSPPSTISDKEIRAKMFNADLLLNGYAQLLTIPPDVKYVDYFKNYQSEARDKNKGLWTQSTVTTVKATTTTQKIVVTTTTLQSIAPQTYGSDLTVYITDTGKKYHFKDCRTLKRSKNLYPLTIPGAKDRGYDSCGVCNPPEN